MKKIFLIFLVFAQVYFCTAVSHAQIPFEDVGRFYGLIQRPDFNLEKAVSLLESGRLKNYRMYADTDDDVVIEFPNQPLNKRGAQLRIMGYRGDENHDIPQSYVAQVLQRLFPSPDGMNLVPNQGSDQDPVFHFTPQTMGAILNFIYDFYSNASGDLDGYASELAFIIDADLHPDDKTIRRIFNPKTKEEYRERNKVKRVGQKSHKSINDFALSLVRALAEQREPSELWEPHLVENALFAFALMKAADNAADIGAAAESVGPVDSSFVRNMKSFYEAMPNVVTVEAYGEPFSYGEYEAVVEKVKELRDEEEDIPDMAEAPTDAKPAFVELTPREKFILLFGLKSFAQIFPTQHFYSTAEYEGIKFPNCGEASLLNLINGLLWDFEAKRLRVDILEDMATLMPEGHPAFTALLQFYRDYSTSAEQFTGKAQQAWVAVVSNLKEFDPHIVYKKAEGRCEITAGMSSMLGVVRALFPDEAFRAISACNSSGPADKAMATLDHLVELFSRIGTNAAPRETWSWKRADAKEGEDEHQLSGSGAKVEFHKNGSNLPIVDDSPLEGALMTWELKKGHYDCEFSLSEVPEYMEVYANRLLSQMVDNSKAFSNLLNSWCIGTYAELIDIVSFKLGFEEIDEDETLLQAIAERVTEEQMTQLLRTFLLHSNYRDQTAQFIAFSLISKAERPYLYRFAANILELLPRGDLHATLAMLPTLITENAQLVTVLPKIHPRVTDRMEEIRGEVKDPKKALECLQDFSGKEYTCLFLLRTMAKGLAKDDISKDDVLKVIFEQSDNDLIGPAFWAELLDTCQGLFVNGEGEFEPEQFMLYRPDEKDSKTVLENLLEDAREDVIHFFLDQEFITKAMIVKEFKRWPTNCTWLLLPGCYRLDVLAKLLEESGFTFAKVLEVRPCFFQSTVFDIFLKCHRVIHNSTAPKPALRLKAAGGLWINV